MAKGNRAGCAYASSGRPANSRLTSRYHPRPLIGRFHRPRIASCASRWVSSPASTCALRWRSWALMTSLWSLPWCSTSQGPPSCLQVMVFMGGKVRVHGRGDFSNPDRSPRGVFGALGTSHATRRSGQLPHDAEDPLDVSPRGAEVRDAGAQSEAPVDRRVGEVDPTIALHVVQNPLVVPVERMLVEMRRRMAKAADAESRSGEELEVLRGPDELGEAGGEPDVLADRRREPVRAIEPQRRPQLEGPKTATELQAVVPESEGLGRLLGEDPDVVIGAGAERPRRGRRVVQQQRAAVDRRVEPLVGIDAHRVGAV